MQSGETVAVTGDGVKSIDEFTSLIEKEIKDKK
jgi:hypothetical protein